MGLLTKEVEVRVNSSNAKYYEELGYKIPKKINKNGKYVIDFNARIKVKTSVLPQKSNVFVNVECDICKKEYDLQYNNYTKGKAYPLVYCKDCCHVLISGENNYRWNNNKTQEERENQRCYPEYTIFVKKVMQRDNYICQCCGNSSSDNMEVHHLNGYNWFVEGRTDEINAVTLCKLCHKNFHLLYGTGNNTKEQYEEWIGYTVEALEKYNGILSTARKIYCVEDGVLYDSVCVISKKFKISTSRIYDVCNHKFSHAHGYHFLWEDKYLKLNEEQLNDLKSDKKSFTKKVICITTGKIFNSLADAARCYNIKILTHISRCCRNMPRHVHAGKLSDGTPLRWMYYEDFLKLSIEEQK